MTDKTERAVRKLALKKNGGPTTADDIFEVVLALADDADKMDDDARAERNELHRESIEAIEALQQQLDEHCIEANVRDAEIEELQRKTALSADTCVDRMQQVARPLVEAAVREADKRHHEFHGEFEKGHLWDGHGVMTPGSLALAPVPRRQGDPPDVDHTADRDTDRHGWLLWLLASGAGRVLVGLSIAILGGIVMLAINLAVYGRP